MTIRRRPVRIRFAAARWPSARATTSRDVPRCEEVREPAFERVGVEAFELGHQAEHDRGVEDDEFGRTPHLLFSVERTLTSNGARFRRAVRNWEANVVQDGALLTGQNPASAAPLAEALVERLRASAPEREHAATASGCAASR
jgi:putative intracellular protease/amidase